MASINTDEMNLNNLSQLEGIDISVPGTYEVKYKYVDSRGRNQSVPLSIYIPDNANIESINFHMPGKGGWDNQVLKEYLSNNDHRSVDVFVNTNQENYNNNVNVFDDAFPLITEDISNTFNIPNNVLYEGHSLGADFCVHSAAYHAMIHPEDNINVLAVNPDWNYEISEAERQAFINSDAKVMYVFSQKTFLNRRNVYNESFNGVHLYDFIVNLDDSFYEKDGEHNVPKILLTECGFSDLANGDFDFTTLPTEYTYSRTGKTYKVSYEVIEHYVNENGEYVTRNISLDELNQVYGCGPYYGGVIQSDNEYLGQCLTQINSRITQLSNSVFTLNVSSTTSIPAKEVALLNSLMNAIKDLCEKMRQELVTMGKIGNKFNDLNIRLESEAAALMASFKSPVASTLLDVPIKDIVNYDYDLDQLIKDYNQYVEEVQAQANLYTTEDLRNKSLHDRANITAEDIENAIVRFGGENSLLRGMGEYYIQAANETGLDPLFLLALSANETGWGNPNRVR